MVIIKDHWAFFIYRLGLRNTMIQSQAKGKVFEMDFQKTFSNSWQTTIILSLGTRP